MYISKKEWNHFCRIRKDLASALSRAEYLQESPYYALEGTVQLSIVFPDIYSDLTGAEDPSEWEIEVICHYEPDRPRALWWGRSFAEVCRKFEEDVQRLKENVDEELSDHS